MIAPLKSLLPMLTGSEFAADRIQTICQSLADHIQKKADAGEEADDIQPKSGQNPEIWEITTPFGILKWTDPRNNEGKTDPVGCFPTIHTTCENFSLRIRLPHAMDQGLISVDTLDDLAALLGQIAQMIELGQSSHPIIDELAPYAAYFLAGAPEKMDLRWPSHWSKTQLVRRISSKELEIIPNGDYNPFPDWWAFTRSLTPSLEMTCNHDSLSNMLTLTISHKFAPLAKSDNPMEALRAVAIHTGRARR